MRLDDLAALMEEAFPLHAEQRDKEASEKIEEALALEPHYTDALFLKALIALSHGNFRGGWPLFELRYQRKDIHPFCIRHLKKPMWDGKPTSNRKVLIWGSEGLGDTVMMLRFLPEVIDRCPFLQVEVQFPLQRLVKYNYPALDVSTVGERRDNPEFDLQCPMLSLPLVLGKELKDITGYPYLKAPECLVADWDFRKPKHVHMGLAWHGNKANAREPARSLSMLALPFLAKAFDFVPLQREHTLFDDVADMAGLMANLDQIVTVDTLVAHLAGAMGKPTHLMLGVNCDWRWLQGRSDTPWYHSLTLYRQQKPDDWSSVVNEVISAIKGDGIVNSPLDQA